MCAAVSTGQCNAWASFWDGVIQFRVCRGLPLSLAAMSSRSAWVKCAFDLHLGKYWRSSPLVFSLLPRCHGLEGSQKARRRTAVRRGGRSSPMTGCSSGGNQAVRQAFPHDRRPSERQVPTEPVVERTWNMARSNRGNQPTPTDNLRRGRGALIWGHPRSAGGSTGGAGDRDRTGMASLEGWGSAIELHPQSDCQAAPDGQDVP